MEVVKAKHLLKENELRQEINTLNDKIKSMEKECNKKVEEATHIKWDKTGEYYNLKDFCRVTRDLLFIKETELKQWLFQQGVLKNENNKYTPNNDICTLIDNELYIKYEFIRNKILLLRSLVFLGDEDLLKGIVDKYRDDKKIIVEQMANTVYVECKQRSVEFKEHRENKFFIGE